MAQEIEIDNEWAQTLVAAINRAQLDKDWVVLETELQRASAQLSDGPHAYVLDQAAALVPSLKLEAAINRAFQDRNWGVLETEMQEVQPQLSSGPYAHTLDQAAALIQEIKEFEAQVCSNWSQTKCGIAVTKSIHSRAQTSMLCHSFTHPSFVMQEKAKAEAEAKARAEAKAMAEAMAKAEAEAKAKVLQGCT